MTRPRSRTSRQTFAWPLTIGAATLAGLVLGLTGDGIPDVAAWLLVGLVPAVIARALLIRPSAKSASSERKSAS